MSLLAAAALASATPAADAPSGFKRLAALAGEWEGRFPDGRAHRIVWRLSAGGTVLIETWTLSPTRESLTLYHLDGARLIATHYCPQGNQPRLALAPSGDPARLAFAFADGTNLQVAGRSHQHSFDIEFRADGRLARREHYVANGTPIAQADAGGPGETVIYQRVASPFGSPPP